MRSDGIPTSQVLHVAYVGPIDYPSSTAPAQRMAGIIQALKFMGHNVSVGSGSRPKAGELYRDSDGVVVHSLGELPDERWSKATRVVRGLTWGRLTYDWIQRLEPKPDIILVYGTPLGYLVRLNLLAHKMGVPLVIDATEWYQSSHLPGGVLGPFSLANALSMRFVARKAQGVIAISSFLQDHFAGQGVRTVRVPPLFSISPQAKQTSLPVVPLKLCYVGSPGNKDLATIKNLVRLPRVLGVAADRLRINIVGLDERWAAAALKGKFEADIAASSLVFHGRLPSDQARQVILDSHFSVLQRGDERYAKAGFPSKVPESLILGTPVMTNLTSDLAEFLVPGKNAVLLDDSTLESLMAAVARSLESRYEFKRDEISALATQQFSPHQYAAAIHDFLLSCRGGLS